MNVGPGHYVRVSGFVEFIGAAILIGLCVVPGRALAERDLSKVSELADSIGLTLGGQIRLRGEVDARDLNSDSGLDQAISSRVRFQVGVSPIDDVEIFIQLQDVRVFGEELNTLTDADADGFDLHQGYFVLKNFFGSGVDIQAGRQEVNFADQRLVGAVDWTQNARSFDGFLARYAVDGVGWIRPFAFVVSENDAVAAGGAIRQLNPNFDEGLAKDTWFAGFHSATTALPGVTIEPHLYYLKNGETDVDLYTLGFYAHGAQPVSSDIAAVYDVTFDYQTGESGDDDVRAFLGAIHGGLKRGGYVLTVGYDYLSGDSNLGDGEAESFNTLFGTNHKFYGLMDYFLNNRADTAFLGFQDIAVKFRAPLAKATSFGADLHWFQTAERDSTASRLGGSRDLGQEIDLWIKHKYNDYLGLSLGYGLFLPGDGLSARFRAADAASERDPRGRSSTGHWAYLMADVKF